MPAVVAVPEMVPDEGSIESPAGSPVADQAMVAVVDESVAESGTAAMGEPDRSDWSPGLATATVSVIVQENEDVPE